jgi:hypothetical protein
MCRTGGIEALRGSWDVDRGASRGRRLALGGGRSESVGGSRRRRPAAAGPLLAAGGRRPGCGTQMRVTSGRWVAGGRGAWRPHAGLEINGGPAAHKEPTLAPHLIRPAGAPIFKLKAIRQVALPPSESRLLARVGFKW